VGSILVSACPTPKNLKKSFETALPKGIWQRFHFNDDNPELPLLFLKGGAIVPTGPVVQHVGEAKLTDTITLLVALDDEGRAEGVLYEDDSDGFGFERGNYLLTTYEAQLLSSKSGNDGGEVLVRVARSEGSWSRPARKLQVRLLLGNSTEVVSESTDGEELRIQVPTAAQVDELVANNQKHELVEREKSRSLLDEIFQEHEAVKGPGQAFEPIDMECGNLTLKVVPWIGGRIISMLHTTSGYQWLEGRFESGCYEEYSGSEFRSSGCTEEYKIVRRSVASLDGEELLALEGDIGGGLVMTRDILVGKNSPDKVNITSRIEARSVGAGSGGFSRLVRLRIRPLMRLDHPLKSIVKYTAIDGSQHELRGDMGFGETIIKGSDRPNGEWTLIDTETDLAVINRFDINEVELCVVSWCPASCTFELWSEERPVSKETPIQISHEYEFINNYKA
jgi:alpha-glucosidase